MKLEASCSTPIKQAYVFSDTITDSDLKLRSLASSIFETSRTGEKDWQTECLNLTSVCNGANLIYSLPTSGGKTLVAEILMLKELLLNKKNVLFILPFVSIVQEKVRSLTPMGLELGFWVEEYAGNRGRIPPVKRRGSRSVLMATIEKAHSIVNALIDNKCLSDLGLVIVDELHMIGEGGSRGACLEIVLTKLRVVSPQTRIIGMSATLANMSDLTQFLSAELYTSTFRPVQLVEYLKVGNNVYELAQDKLTSGQLDEEVLNACLSHRRLVHFNYTKQMLARDPDHLVALVAETLLGYSMQDHSELSTNRSERKRFSCLVFCPTKVHCENTARMLAELLPPASCFPETTESDDKAEKLVQKRAMLLSSLRLDSQPDSVKTDAAATTGKPNGETGACCPVLEITVPRGVAYHHGGLTQEERGALEEAYSEGTLSVLCCTSTLAAGVNLPARRVIIRKPYIGIGFLSGTQYQQIVGRAGRAGLDSFGESVTILQPNERPHFTRMLSTIPRICNTQTTDVEKKSLSAAALCSSSLLYDNGKGMRQFLLSLIGLQLAVSFRDIIQAIRKTLFAIQATDCGRDDLVTGIVRTELQALIDKGLILVTSDEAFRPTRASPSRVTHLDGETLRFQATQLGRASVKGGLDTDQVGPLLADLRQAARSLNTSGPLHLLYLVAPPDVIDQIKLDWTILHDRFSLLPPTHATLLTVLGYPEGYLLWKATGHPIRKKLDERPLRRLYVALALSELWQQSISVPIWRVAERYKLSRGSLQTALASAASLASALAHALASEYSSDEELWAFAHMLPEFATRLAYCVSSELLPLMGLPGVKRTRARQLYTAGFSTLKDIACTTVPDLTSRLAPFLSRGNATTLIQAARMLVAEQADALHQEASELLQGMQPNSVMSQLVLRHTRQPSHPSRILSQPTTNQEKDFHMTTGTPIEEEEEEDLFA